MPSAATADTQPSIARIVSAIADDAQNLVRQQIAMFRAEVKQDIRTARTAALQLAVALGVGLIGITLLAFMAAYGLAAAFVQIPLWACFGIVGASVLVASCVVFYLGIQKLEFVGPAKSMDAVKENIQWLTSSK